MPRNREEALTLQLLNAIDARSDVTQRHLADRLGVALGLANSYLKRCVRKGLVKVTQAPANRYLYYLTPQGFIEKSRLTRDYLAASLDFYRLAGASMARTLEHCEAAGARRVLLAGVSELAEIGAIRAHDRALEILGTYDAQSGRTSFIGRPVWSSLAELPDCDAAILTALGNPAEVRRELAARLEDGRILVPDLVAPLLAREDGPAGVGIPPALQASAESSGRQRHAS